MVIIKKMKKAITLLILALVLALPIYAATDEEINAKIQKDITDTTTSDDGIALSTLQKDILDISKEKGFKILPETKYQFYKKHKEIVDSDKVMYLTVIRRDMRLSSNEIKQLSPVKQADIGAVIKTGSGAGTATSWIIGLIIAAIVLFLFTRYNKEYRLGRQARDILKFEKATQRLQKKEEANMGTIGEIEENKRKLILENMKEVKNFEEDEKEKERLDKILKTTFKGVRFKGGLYDKDLKAMKDVKGELQSFRISESDAGKIADIVYGKRKFAAHNLEKIIKEIRDENIRLERLFGKELTLNKDVIEELLKGKEKIDVSQIELNKIKEFIERSEKS